jgi:hypothetical protein
MAVIRGDVAPRTLATLVRSRKDILSQPAQSPSEPQRIEDEAEGR